MGESNSHGSFRSIALRCSRGRSSACTASTGGRNQALCLIASATPIRPGEPRARAPQPRHADAGPERADGDVEAGEVAVEERPLGAPEEQRREHACGARPRKPEHAEPVAEQAGEGERRQAPGERVGQDVQPGAEDEVRGREQQLGQARVLEVVRPVPLGLRDGLQRRVQQEPQPGLVALRRGEVVPLSNT